MSQVILIMRFIPFIVVGIVVFTIAGCGGGNTGDSRKDKDDTKPLLKKTTSTDSFVEDLELVPLVQRGLTESDKYCGNENKPRFLNFHQCVIYFENPESIKNGLRQVASKYASQVKIQEKGFAREIRLEKKSSETYQGYVQIINPGDRCVRVALVLVHKWDFSDATRDPRGYLWVEDIKTINFPESSIDRRDLNNFDDISTSRLTGGKTLSNAIFYNVYRPLEYAVFDLNRCKGKLDKFDAKVYFYDEASTRRTFD